MLSSPSFFIYSIARVSYLSPSMPLNNPRENPIFQPLAKMPTHTITTIPPPSPFPITHSPYSQAAPSHTPSAISAAPPTPSPSPFLSAVSRHRESRPRASTKPVSQSPREKGIQLFRRLGSGGRSRLSRRRRGSRLGGSLWRRGTWARWCRGFRI